MACEEIGLASGARGGFNQLDCGVYVDMDRPDSTSMHARQDMWLGFWPDKNDPIQF